METIRILQLGKEDWNNKYSLPSYVKLTYANIFKKAPRTPYEIVIVDRAIYKEELELLLTATKAHTLYVTAHTKIEGPLAQYFVCKKGKKIKEEEIQDFLSNEARNYFPNPYGEKFSFRNFSIAHGFPGTITWNGNYSVELEADFGEKINQIGSWRNNIPIFHGQAIDFWLEYKKDGDVEIALVITQFRQGSISEVQQKWYFSEEELQEVVTVDNQLADGPIFVALLAKGSGKLEIIALHDRYSRRGHGVFLPGGDRFVTSNREEVFYYFDPGDLKPPLNVYFSGYKTMQGFEGYYMMRKMGCPFLLIGEPRLEGGAFYLGDAEYEKGLADVIRMHMEELGFTSDQVILSGMSMGTFGAMYYGCDILPHAMILGKPLASLGLVAENERLHRPGGFPTSLDLIRYLISDSDTEAIETLNQRFWDKFDRTDWSKSKFVVAYMIEDDYDSTAYEKMLSHLKTAGVQVYGKGIHGRHNDATGPIANWFKSQYDAILRADFGRGDEK